MLQSSDEKEITPVFKTQVKRILFGQSDDLEKNACKNDIIYWVLIHIYITHWKYMIFNDFIL